ncbi:MAG: hypothetical protein ABH804_02295 [archaeon]
MKKRGLSEVIITLLLIGLALIAIGIVWFIVQSLISKSAEDISLEGFKISLKIKSVGINGNNMSVRIGRGSGSGNLYGIKFLIYEEGDTQSSEQTGISLGELETRTFYITFTGQPEKISIAPIYITESGKKVLGNIVDTYIIKRTDGSIEEGCETDCVCAEETCIGQTCIDSCTGETCDGALLPDCGERVCGNSPNGCGNCGTCGVGYSCVGGVCIYGCNPNCEGKECGEDGCGGLCGLCTEGSTCQDGICSTEPCTPDCGDRECGNAPNGCDICGVCESDSLCIDSYCVKKEAVAFGTVDSVWPPGIGLYFDTEDISKREDFTSFYVKFTTGPETRCLLIEDFMLPQFPEIYDKCLVRLVTYSSVQPGNSYQIWQDYGGCSG